MQQRTQYYACEHSNTLTTEIQSFKGPVELLTSRSFYMSGSPISLMHDLEFTHARVQRAGI